MIKKYKKFKFNINADPWTKKKETPSRVVTTTYANGQTMLEETYYWIDRQNDELLEVKEWYDDGSLKMTITFDRKDNLFTERTYYKGSGNKQSIYTYYKDTACYGDFNKEYDQSGQEIDLILSEFLTTRKN